MNKAEAELMATEVFNLFKGYVGEVQRSFQKQIDALTLRLDTLPTPKDGINGKDGSDGRSPDESVMLASLTNRLEQLVSAIPAPKDGINGKDADPEEMRLMLREAIAQIPAPKDGLPGKDGADGQTPDPEVIKALVIDLVAEIPKPRDGVDGKDGNPGKDGASADPEHIKELVTRAVAEIPKPADGRDGLRGEPGRDATQIEVLSAIDETRAYPRGTFASHKGGTWRAFKTTEAMNGWECIVDGVADIAIKADETDPRVISIGVTRSSGKQSQENFRIPMVVYKGLYKEGVPAEKGDAFTWARSLWIARNDTDSPPGEGPDWQLAVKQGAAGSDAYELAKRAGFKGTVTQWLESLRGAKGEDGRQGMDFNRVGPPTGSL